MDVSKENKFSMIRREFPVTEKYAYLDTATTGLFSKKSHQAMVDFIDHRFNEGVDIPEFLALWRHADDLRKLVAEMINADADEIFYADNSSTILNVFSNGIAIKENSNVVTTNLSFPATPYNWMNRLGGVEKVRIVESKNGMIPYEDLISHVDENTVAIALCLVENTSGYRHDIARIGKFCEEKGIYLVLDATQCISAMEIDVKKMHVDYLAASSYKWLNNVFGVGFGYVSKRVLEKTKPAFVGWVGNKDRSNHSRYNLNLSDGANRFETGSVNWIGLKGMEQSIKTYLELGKKDVEEYILGLTAYLYEKVQANPALGIIGPFPEANRSGITYVKFPGEWGLDDTILRENGIRAHVADKGLVRISLHYFNNRNDIDRLVEFMGSCGK